MLNTKQCYAVLSLVRFMYVYRLQLGSSGGVRPETVKVGYLLSPLLTFKRFDLHVC